MQGVSGKTTAKLTSQHGLLYGKLLKKHGLEQAQLYWQANQDAVAQLGALAKTADCDFSVENNYIYATAGTQQLESEMDA